MALSTGMLQNKVKNNMPYPQVTVIRSENFLRFLAILLIYMQMARSQEFLEISDRIVEFGYTEGQTNHLKEKRDVNTVNTNMTQYMIIVEVNVSQAIYDQIRLSLQSMTSFKIDNTTEINSFNITTVCSLNNTEYQCRCEDQYFWPCEKCTKYGSCNNDTRSSCGCINAFPNDGQFCQPNTELMNSSTCISTTTPANYLMEVEIDALDIIVLNQLRVELTRFSFPITKSNVEFVELNITTVCSLNNTKYQCKCEDQYFWPCEKCTKYGSCNNITSSSCGCINTFPNDGYFCQPTNELLNSSTCISTTTPVSSTTPPVPSTPPPVPSTPDSTLSFAITINGIFDVELTDKTTATYKDYDSKIRKSVDSSFRNVFGYVNNSASVTGFRSGSIIVDFTIQTTNSNLNLSSVSQTLVKNLRDQGFSVNDNALSQSVNGGLYNMTGYIYPGKDLLLTCSPPESNSINWYFGDINLQSSNQYEIIQNKLNVKDASDSVSGQYKCITTVNSLPYIIWQNIQIEPYPDIQVTSNKVEKCSDATITLQCCVQKSYQVQWSSECSKTSTDPQTGCELCDYIVKETDCNKIEQEIQFTCRLNTSIAKTINPKTTIINVKNQPFLCYNSLFGAGNNGDTVNGSCSSDKEGYQIAQCISNNWNVINDQCVLRVFVNLLAVAEVLTVENIKDFMSNLSSTAASEIGNITDSSATIVTIVKILNIVSSLSQTISIDKPIMENFLSTSDVIGSDGARGQWMLINNNNANKNISSLHLDSTESIARRLTNESVDITTNLSSLNKLSFKGPFTGVFGKNSATQINIPANNAPTSFTVIISEALDNILPVRNLTYNNSSQTGTSINGDVAVIETNTTINDILLSFNVKSKTLGSPQCVYWNFTLLNGIGGWDTTGCQLKPVGNETERFTCECNHTTSFSILMSPFTLSKEQTTALAYITYIGVAISMASLVLCLIIEIIIWKSVTRNDTSYMRHVSIVNIALSLLIANICFIIGAAVVNNGEGPCSTATFFMHFFYLALFFWMFVSALLLLYRTIMVFSRMTRGAMMAIGFTVGYGAPLIIAVVTVASTAGGHGYIQKDYNCWLNWNITKALLAFVIPALTIVAINLLVLVVVLCKMLRRGGSTQPDEKHPLVIIARCVAILTPLFGLTWGFGIGTMVSPNFGIHVVFAFLNSLQGFFILVFGTLLDSKVREALAGTFSLRNLSSNRTRSTSAGPSSSSGVPFIQRLRHRNMYNVSNPGFTSSSSTNDAVN
ncbi:adhesion G protein-coupled receptor F5-like isoform X3 [Silurus meridionalis]|uniref:adhesion G protein-coupled receptor F5-like isoform X3 n=1 Tax=Silurus meridionalis TaxID=175797 RepID=UPI001EE9CC03|nr:adhesion G protein-coupled receptor F5-like isoform X3 [Silurus meridionalis]